MFWRPGHLTTLQKQLVLETRPPLPPIPLELHSCLFVRIPGEFGPKLPRSGLIFSLDIGTDSAVISAPRMRSICDQNSSATANRFQLFAAICSLLLFSVFLLPAAEEQYIHQIWRTEDGLDNPVIRAITQDKAGYLWLGTDDGLVRFDGAQFRAFEQKERSDWIERWVVGIAATRDGSVWASSINGGIVQVKDGFARHHDVAENQERYDYVLALLEDSKGLLWAGTASGLARYQSGRFVAVPQQPDLPVEAVRALAEDKAGNLWIGTVRGLIRYDGKTFVDFSGDDRLVNPSVMALCVDSKNVLWVGTSAGLSRIENGKARHYTTANGLRHDIVRCIYEDQLGQIWIGTQGGLQRYEDGALKDVPLRSMAEDFEGITFVYTIFEDRERNLWVGSNLGLNRLRRSRFTNISREEGLPHNLATLAYESEPGTLWVGTYGGGLAIIRSNRVEKWSVEDGQLTSNYIIALHRDRQGTYWFGTDGKGLLRYKDGEFTSFRGNRFSENNIRVIFEDSQNNLWVGHNLGVSRLENDQLVHDPRFPRNIVKAILEDKRKRVWVASRSGLSEWRDGQITVYRQPDGLCSERVNALYEDEDGILWIGTETGLNRMAEPGKFVSFMTSDGPFREHILHILEDDDGYLWLSTRNGILRAEKAELNRAAAGGARHHVNIISYNRRDGMRRAQCNGIAQPAGWKLSDGRLCFPTMQGVVLFDPKEITINETPPPVMIEEVVIDGIPLTNFANIKLPPGSKQVEIRYTGLSFHSPDKVRFRYKLVGVDSNWEDAGTRRFARFLHLAPGDYTFYVKACNNDGVWSEESAALHFSLSRYFYQSPWFYAACFSGLLVAGISAHFVRVRNHKKREEELETLVNQRTAKLQEMIKSMESYNYSIAHDLRAPIRAIRGFTQALVEDYKPNLDELGREYAERIESAVERMDQLIQDLLIYGQLSHKEIPLETVNLETVLDRVIESFAVEIEMRKAVVEVKKPLGTAWGNSTILTQILSNLLGNALKFVEQDKTPHVKIWTETKGRRIRVCVKDNGIGIKPEYHERIFRIFERLHSVEVFPGTGIGLAIVQKGAERMGGSAGVESTYGQGSCFWVELGRSGDSGKSRP